MPTSRHVDGDAELRICLVLATSEGGVGRHVRALASGFRDERHVVAVLGPAATEARFDFTACGARFAAAEIGSGIRALTDLGAAARIAKIGRDADVVHAHGLRAAVVTAVALRRFARPFDGRRRSRRPVFVVTLHNAMLGSALRRRSLGLVERWLARSSDAILAVSPDLVASLRKARSDVDRALVASTLPPPTRDPAATRRALGIDADSSLVLSVGRLHPQKGFDVLVAATSLLARRDAAPVVVVAGDGPLRAELESLVAAAKVDVRLLGDRSDIADLVAAADLVVMPSRWEGWPLAAAEVLGGGRPLIASAVGGLPELVGGGAILVPAGDAGALATAIEAVLSDAALRGRLADSALERARQLPTDRDVTASLLGVYGRALADQRTLTRRIVARRAPAR